MPAQFIRQKQEIMFMQAFSLDSINTPTSRRAAFICPFFYNIHSHDSESLAMKGNSCHEME